MTSPGSGSNGARLSGWPVSASDPIVRPWKPPWAATIFVLPVSRDILKATSLASVPELQKNTRAGAPRWSVSASANAIPGSVAYRFEVCPNVFSWVVTASITAGCRCPSTLTAMPPSRST
ncbi:hypothetical protein C1Y40_04918 [Mycobacterium talmoniae]|uniref:Uncharacterized protein n=1 Tax=Mycobacterium talmoniae TaxID=1858794 RepID=A0A2S8BE14_9MYCO|nr:hypothetical protein C1Y40_04918 [Mycobacterium talmoniae]